MIIHWEYVANGCEGHGGGEKNGQGKHISKGTLNKSIVPLSIWPKLLERSYKCSSPTSAAAVSAAASTNSCNGGDNKKDATGLYYLIRNGPIIGVIASQRGYVHVVEKKKYADSKEEKEEEKRCKKKPKRTASSSLPRYQRRPNHFR